VVVWFLIALWTFVDPSFHQRSGAAKDERTARNGILVSVAFWFLFDIMTVGTGLYARAAMTGLDQPALSYPALAEMILPAGLKGFFVVGLLATVMSTLTSYLMLAGGTAGRDIAARVKGIEGDRGWVRGGLLAGSLGGIALAWAVPSVVSLWYTIGSCFVPGLLLPVVGSYFPRMRLNGSRVIVTMLVSSGISTLSLVLGQVNAQQGIPQYFFGVEPLLPGLAASIILWLVFSLAERRKAI
jgi:SSS family solute:Na+ symporter